MQDLGERLARIEKTAELVGILQARKDRLNFHTSPEPKFPPFRNVDIPGQLPTNASNAEALRKIVREEIALAYSRHLSGTTNIPRYSQNLTKDAIESSQKRELGLALHDEKYDNLNGGLQEKIASETQLGLKKEGFGKVRDENVCPGSPGMPPDGGRSQAVQPDEPKASEKSENFLQIGSVSEKSDDAEGPTLEELLYARVESRAALAKRKHDTGPKVFLSKARSLSEAAEISLPMFLGGFSRDNWIRKICFHMFNSVHWKALFITVNVANCLLIASYPEIYRDDFNAEGYHPNASSGRRMETASRRLLEESPNGVGITLISVFEIFCAVMMTLELSISCIAVGLTGHPTAFLPSSYFHKLDFLIFIFTILEYVLQYSQGIMYFSFRAFRLLRLLKPLLSMEFFEDVKEVLETLAQGVAQLVIITAVLILFLLAFSVLGMAMYQKSFRRRCIKLDHLVPSCSTDPPYTDWRWGACNISGARETKKLVPGGDLTVMGGYPFDTYCKIYRNSTPNQYDKRYPMDPSGQYHDCSMREFLEGRTVDTTCAELQNSGLGFQHFDNVGGALLALTQIFLGDGPIDVLHHALNSEPDTAALTWIYFFVITFIITWVVLSLFVAVVVNTFQEVKSKKEFDAKKRKGGDNGSMDSKMIQPKVEELDEVETDGGVLLAVWASSCLKDPKLRHGVSCTILLHIVAMSFEQYDASDFTRNITRMVYFIANFIFGAELLLRMAACGGSRTFFSDSFHLLEICLLACGLAGLAKGSRFLSLVPSIRVLRLCPYWPTLHDLLLDCVETQRAFLNVLMFMGLVCLCFAVAGRYVFRDEMDPQTEFNFGNLPQALITIFQLFAGEQWSTILFTAMSVKPDMAQQIYACFFILVWLFIAKVIFFGLLVAVLVENFQVVETVRLIKEPGRISKFKVLLKNSYQRLYSLYAHPEIADSYGNDVQANHKSQHSSEVEADWFLAEDGHELSEYELLLKAMMGLKVRQGADPDAFQVTDETTLLMFGPTNRFRMLCERLRKNHLFSLLIYVSIAFSCVSLIVTPPAEDLPSVSSPFPLVLRTTLDKVLTAIFTVEFLVCTVSQGFMLTENAYLRSVWNVSDFIILVLSWVDLSGVFKGSILKIGRALRPLRLAKRVQAVRELMEALFATMPPMAYVIWLWMMFLLVFAIVGMGLFGGLLFRCSYGAEYPLGKAECSGFETDLSRGVIMPRAWDEPHNNYDTLPSAILSLFRVTYVNFVDNMYAVMAITEKDISPTPLYSMHYSLYFVAYLLIAAFFVMNVFIAFISDGFNVNRGTSEADVNFSKFLRQMDTRLPRTVRFREPSNRASRALRALLDSRHFKAFSMTCVGVNVGFMLADHADPSPDFQRLIQAQDLFFFLEIVVENLLSLGGFGPKVFVYDTWKFFDLLVMLGSATSFVSTNSKISSGVQARVPDSPYGTGVEGAFRLFRVIRLMRMIKPVRIILETMISSLPSFGNMLLLMVLVNSIFATVFVQLFGLTKYGNRVGPTAGFADYASALATCFQIISQDDWITMMDDVSVEYPSCTVKFDAKHLHGYHGPDYSFGDCGTPFAPVLLIAFMVVSVTVLLNLFVGVILEKFGFVTDEIAAREDPAWACGPSGAQFDAFVRTFEHFAGGTRTISVRAAIDGLLFAQEVPLGFRDPELEGGAEFEAPERAARRLARAELNLALCRRREREARWRRRWGATLVRLLALMGLARPPDPRPDQAGRRAAPGAWRRWGFVNGVDFAEVALALLHVRKPSLVPDAVKASRRQVVEEVRIMAAALVVADALRRALAPRHREEALARLGEAGEALRGRPPPLPPVGGFFSASFRQLDRPNDSPRWESPQATAGGGTVQARHLSAADAGGEGSVDRGARPPRLPTRWRVVDEADADPSGDLRPRSGAGLPAARRPAAAAAETDGEQASTPRMSPRVRAGGLLARLAPSVQAAPGPAGPTGRPAGSTFLRGQSRLESEPASPQASGGRAGITAVSGSARALRASLHAPSPGGASGTVVDGIGGGGTASLRQSLDGSGVGGGGSRRAAWASTVAEEEDSGAGDNVAVADERQAEKRRAAEGDVAWGLGSTRRPAAAAVTAARSPPRLDKPPRADPAAASMAGRAAAAGGSGGFGSSSVRPIPVLRRSSSRVTFGGESVLDSSAVQSLAGRLPSSASAAAGVSAGAGWDGGTSPLAPHLASVVPLRKGAAGPRLAMPS